MKITDVSNIAALGAEWTSDSGATMQLVNRRGSVLVTLGMLPAGARRWTSTVVNSPERFGTVPVADETAMLAYAARFTA